MQKYHIRIEKVLHDFLKWDSFIKDLLISLLLPWYKSSKKSRPLRSPPWQQTFLAKVCKLAALRQCRLLNARKARCQPTARRLPQGSLGGQRKLMQRDADAINSFVFILSSALVLLMAISGRRRSVGWKTSVLRKKFVLFERSEFTNF